MKLWLIRAGKAGQHEGRFLDESRVYLTWSGFGVDLSGCASAKEVKERLAERYPQMPSRKLSNHAGQIWAFAGRMQEGDLAVVPSKHNPTVHVAEIAGGYTFIPAAPDPYFHYRQVRWLERDVPRERFGKDLLSSFGALMSICRVQRNDAEARLTAMRKNGWQDPLLKGGKTVPSPDDTQDEAADDLEAERDLAEEARDAVARLILAQTKGHGLSDLVGAVLRAQGYTTEVSPPGPDGGIDIVAGTGPLGFGEPRLCVQVKSTDGLVDSPTLHQLVGSMSSVGATQGLLVSWSGFKKSVDKERIGKFFGVRLWDQSDLMAALFDVYDKLDADVKAMLPLKRVWVPVVEEE